MTKRQSQSPSKKRSGSGKAVKGRKNTDTSVVARLKLRFARRGLWGFVWRFTMAFAALLILLPLGLLLVYRIEPVHPVSTLMMRDWLTGTGVRREWIELDDLAPVVYQSVMMSEDGRFCSHGGVDWTELNKVIDDAIEGEKTRGASTISMQLVKNLFLWPNRSFIRKGLEVPYALMAEAILGKRRILEIYLNIVELDRGVFGVEAAGRHYFNRSAAKLGRRHSALLAVTLPNPLKRNPAKPTRRLSALAATIQKRARASGAYIKCITGKE